MEYCIAIVSLRRSSLRDQTRVFPQFVFIVSLLVSFIGHGFSSREKYYFWFSERSLCCCNCTIVYIAMWKFNISSNWTKCEFWLGVFYIYLWFILHWYNRPALPYSTIECYWLFRYFHGLHIQRQCCFNYKKFYSTPGLM